MLSASLSQMSDFLRPLRSDAAPIEVGHLRRRFKNPIRPSPPGRRWHEHALGRGWYGPTADLRFQLVERDPIVNRRRPRSGGFQPPSRGGTPPSPFQKLLSSVTAWKAMARTRTGRAWYEPHCRYNVSARGTRLKSKPPEAKERAVSALINNQLSQYFEHLKRC